MPIGTTDLTTLEQDIAAMIMDRTPSLQTRRGDRWHWSESNQPAGPGKANRFFTIAWGRTKSVPEGVTGHSDMETEIEMSIVTDYGSVPERELGQIVGTDHVDLEHWLGDRLHPAIQGLMWVESDGHVLVGDETTRRISHDFTVHYQRAI